MSKIVQGVALAAAVYVTGGALLVAAPEVFAVAGYAGLLNTLALNAFLSGVAAQLRGSKSQRQNYTAEYSGTIESRSIIYGTVRTSGMQVLPPFTTGNNNRYLHQVLALAGHEVDAITDIYFATDVIASADIFDVIGTDNDGKVEAGPYEDVAWIRRYTGTSTQTADFKLDSALSVWTSSHRGRGVAYVAIQFRLDDDAYKLGKPEITAVVRGKKCYDPRLDTSPGANPANALYIAYTTNPALCLADYLTTALGMGEDPANIDWDMVSAAADICDETVAIPTSSMQSRYTCNCVLLATDPYEDNIVALTTAMMGSCLYSGGKWRIRAGCWEAPTFEIIDASLTDGGVQMTTAYPYKERYNGVRGTYVDPTTYQFDEFPAVQDASYVTADGESVFKDVRLNACTDVHEAQRSAILLTRKSRNRRSASIACGMDAWKIRPGDTGIVTLSPLGWDEQTVRCEGWKFNPQGSVELVVREESADDWDDPLESDYVTPLAITTPAQAYFTPDAPSGLATLGTPRAVNLSWTAPDLMPSGAYYEVYEYASSTPFASASLVWHGIATSCQLDKSDLTTRYYWIRVVTPNGVAGPEYPTSSAGVPGAAVPDAITISLTTSYTAIQCSFSGTPVTGAFDSAVGQVTVLSGATDVTADCTFSGTASNCVGSVNTATDTPETGAIGSYRITSLTTAETGYLEITVAYGGASQSVRFGVSKVRNGSMASDMTIALDVVTDIATTEPLPIGDSLSILAGSGGNFRCNMHGSYLAVGSGVTTNLECNFQYRAVGDPTWIDLPDAEAIGSLATDSSPGYLECPDTDEANTGGAGNYEFRLVGHIVEPFSGYPVHLIGAMEVAWIG